MCLIQFCSTRKSSVSAAEHLANEISVSNNILISNQHVSRDLQAAASGISDKKLSECVKKAVAFHHGGTSFADRRIIEDLFLGSKLAVICTTSTLAVGVNLPAHLVIIKGTSQYISGKLVKYSSMDIQQMVGRAGRPQFDASGVAVIMTKIDDRTEFLNAIDGKEVIESGLHLSLIEHINAEAVLQSITSTETALEWLRSTFLYVRIKRNPAFYRLKNCSSEEAKLSAENRLESIFTNDIDRLRDHGLVDVNSNTAGIISTEYGAIMARYYLCFDTMVHFIGIGPNPSLKDTVFLHSS